MIMQIFVWLGILCLIHYMIIIAYASRKAAFASFWLVSGVGCQLIYIVYMFIKERSIIDSIPIFVWILLGMVIGIGIIIFIVLLIKVMSRLRAKDSGNIKCCIVLGAKVDGRRITKSLLRRVEKAYEFLKNNPEAIVIVSGGQGPCEDISEAEAMYRYLVDRGISRERVLKEEKSTTTKENLVFSSEIIKTLNGDMTLGIITSSFHIYRAELLAKKLGIVVETGIAARSDKILFVNYLFRECAALVKEKMLGNI